MQQFQKFSNFRNNEDRLSLDRRVEPLKKKGQEGYSRRQRNRRAVGVLKGDKRVK